MTLIITLNSNHLVAIKTVNTLSFFRPRRPARRWCRSGFEPSLKHNRPVPAVWWLCEQFQIGDRPLADVSMQHFDSAKRPVVKWINSPNSFIQSQQKEPHYSKWSVFELSASLFVLVWVSVIILNCGSSAVEDLCWFRQKWLHFLKKQDFKSNTKTL